MNNSIKIAFRNTLRNKRRTLLSLMAIAIGGFASLLIGSFVNSVKQGIQTNVARSSGHLHIHKKGYFNFGTGTVDEYDIKAYDKIIDAIKSDPINNYINIITPTLSIGGIASNSAKGNSQTFVGVGVVADEQLQMQSWDGYDIKMPVDNTPFLNYQNGALMGKGLAQSLGFCKVLNIEGCKEKNEAINTNPLDDDIASFLPQENTVNNSSVTLLAASSKGAPNILKLTVEKSWKQNNKEMDDRFIAMPLQKAQILVYGNDIKKVNTINIQLHSPNDIDTVAKKLQLYFSKHHKSLEVIKLHEFNPQIGRVLGMFFIIFTFVSLIIGLIVTFTISNTMTMSIMERFSEIGTLRSMGLRRNGIRTYFIFEGAIIGIFGATFGVLLAVLGTTTINHIELMWTPPSVSAPTKLVFNLLDNTPLIFAVWLFLVLVSIVSTLLPAIKASKMEIIDALRHN